MESHKYDDIIHLTHHVSDRRVPMSRADRAAQFSAFAALTGYDGVIRESGRLTEAQILLDEDSKTMLNEKLRMILEIIDEQPRINITFFQPDERKAGGTYVSVSGRVKKIDEYARAVMLTDGSAIPIERIYQIELP